MNTGFRRVLPMYDIFGGASDFAHNFRHLMLTTLNCGATRMGFVSINQDLYPLTPSRFYFWMEHVVTPI